MPTGRGWNQVGPEGKKVKPAVADGNKRNRAATNLYADPQGAPADGYNKSDNNQVAAAASNPDLTFSQMDAAAASNTGLSEDGVGECTWGLAYPDTKRADVKTGKASFDGLGQIIKPSQGPAEGEISTASDFHTEAAGSVSPKNALSQAPDPVHQDIMAAKSKHSQMHLATITENTELEQPSSSACSYDEANIDNLPRVLPHHGNSLWQRVIDLIHCFGPRKMKVDQVVDHFPIVVGICQTAVKQLQDIDSNTSALQAQVDALVSVNKQQQLQIDLLTEVLKQHMLLPQDVVSSKT